MRIKAHSIDKKNITRRRVYSRASGKTKQFLKGKKQFTTGNELKNELLLSRVRFSPKIYRTDISGENIGNVAINIVAHNENEHVNIITKVVKKRKVYILDSGDYSLRCYVSSSVSRTELIQFLKLKNFHSIEVISKIEYPQTIKVTKNIYVLHATYSGGNGEGGNV